MNSIESHPRRAEAAVRDIRAFPAAGVSLRWEAGESPSKPAPKQSPLAGTLSPELRRKARQLADSVGGYPSGQLDEFGQLIGSASTGTTAAVFGRTHVRGPDGHRFGVGRDDPGQRTGADLER